MGKQCFNPFLPNYEYVTDGEETVAEIPVNGEGTFSAPLSVKDGKRPLFFEFRGRGKCNFHSILLK